MSHQLSVQVLLLPLSLGLGPQARAEGNDLEDLNDPLVPDHQRQKKSYASSYVPSNSLAAYASVPTPDAISPYIQQSPLYPTYGEDYLFYIYIFKGFILLFYSLFFESIMKWAKGSVQTRRVRRAKSALEKFLYVKNIDRIFLFRTISRLFGNQSVESPLHAFDKNRDQ